VRAELIEPQVHFAVESGSQDAIDWRHFAAGSYRPLVDVDRECAILLEDPAFGIAPFVTHRDRKVENARNRPQRQVQPGPRAIGDDRVGFFEAVDPDFEDQLVLIIDQRLACGRRIGDTRSSAQCPGRVDRGAGRIEIGGVAGQAQRRLSACRRDQRAGRGWAGGTRDDAGGKAFHLRGR
jgi:hypothetical protein